MIGFNSEEYGDPFGAFDDFVDEARRREDEALKAAGLLLEAQIKNKLSTPGTGRIRRRLARRLGRLGRRGARTFIGKAGRASSPGEPPAPDTGALRNSVLYHKELGVHIVGTDQVQAAALEFGTNRAGRGHHTRILPRPYMRPALNEVREKMGDAVAARMRFGGGNAND